MNRSTQSLRLVFVGATAIALVGVGCRRDEPAQQPPTPEAAPPATEPGGAQPQQPGAPGQTAPGTPAPGYMAPGAGQQGQMGGQGQMGEGQMGQMGERDVCSMMAQHGNIRVEDVENGVAIVLTPKQGGDLSMIRMHGVQASYMLAPASAGHAAHTRPQSASERCSLFDLGSYAARTGVIEQGNQVRLILLGQDEGNVQTLRSQARLFAQEWGGR